MRVRLVDGVNPQTVWTWNPIGKRKGAWNLSPDAAEATQGFLPNHLIDDLLPNGDASRQSNSDPVTGQAAWYDLRVEVEKAGVGDGAEVEPAFETLGRPPGLRRAPLLLQFGREFRRKG